MLENILEKDRLYLAEHIKRRLLLAKLPIHLFEEARLSGKIEIIECTPQGVFYCLADKGLTAVRVSRSALPATKPVLTNGDALRDNMCAIFAESSGSSISKLEDGSYLGRCCTMIEIGTVTEAYEGQKPKAAKKVRLVFEVIGETYESNDGVVKPRLVAKQFTLSMHEKATLRKFLESWRTKKFTEEEAKKFDITVLMGKPCALTLIANAKGYPEISSVAAPMKGVKVGEMLSEPKELSYASWDEDLFLAQPEFVRNTMQKTPEYMKLKGIEIPKEMTPAPIDFEEPDGFPF